MCYTNSGKVSVVSEVIPGEGDCRPRRINEFLPTECRVP